jgi:hypothetical protein
VIAVLDQDMSVTAQTTGQLILDVLGHKRGQPDYTDACTNAATQASVTYLDS